MEENMIKKLPSQFDRIISLIGNDNFNKLKSKKIIVVGVGGVGGFVVESLVRSGISNITIVDHDTVDITNLNRQIIALNSTIGKLKVDVLEKRIKDINKDCIVEKYPIFLDDSNIDEIIDDSYDFIIDCCDSVKTKQLLLKTSVDKNIDFIASMGTANKIDPTKLEIIELSKTVNDPLARIMRKYVKDLKIKKKIMVLSSTELANNYLDDKSILASISYNPAIAGLLISSYVIKKIMK